MRIDIPRKIAVDILLKIEFEKSYSNLTISKYFNDNNLSGKDKAFISALVYGTLDRKISIDYIISKYIKTTVSKIKPITRMALRIAIFQIAFLDKIPPSAAVNESVNIVKASKEKFNASFTNGVLRSYLRNPVELPTGNDVRSLKFRYSCPEWIINSFINDFGEDTTVKLLEESLKTPPMVLRANTVKISDNDLFEQLKIGGVNGEKGDIDGSFLVSSSLDVKNNPLYKKGYFYIEDLASQKMLSQIGIKKGDRILDTCSAPGGKSFTMSMLCQNEGEIVSLDLYEHRVELIKNGAQRLGINIIKPMVWDATKFSKDLGLFDVVLCDVPCSGLGVIRRKPEIKYKEVSHEDMQKLLKTQEEIINCSGDYVKPGGVLVYSTCTLSNSENRLQITAFLDKHPNYELQYISEFMPHIDGTDGFFFAKLKRTR